MSDGTGCECYASNASECCCDNVDWRSAREIELEVENAQLRKQLAAVAKERDEIAAQARMLDRMVDERDEQLAAALAACEAKDDRLLDCAGNINPERGRSPETTTTVCSTPST